MLVAEIKFIALFFLWRWFAFVTLRWTRGTADDPCSLTAPDFFEFPPAEFSLAESGRKCAPHEMNTTWLASAAVDHDPVVEILLPMLLSNHRENRKACQKAGFDYVEIQIRETRHANTLFAQCGGKLSNRSARFGVRRTIAIEFFEICF